MFDWLKKKNQNKSEKSSAAGDGVPNGPGPDFSHVDSLAKAEELHRQGVLVRVFLMPLEYGGVDIGPNVLYVPSFAAEMKANIDHNIVKELAAQGKVTRYTATPGYQGDSFVPSSITVTASEPGSFSSVIKIWGEALR